MANKRSLSYDLAGGEAVEQPALLTVPGPSPAGTSLARERTRGSQPPRSERTRQAGLAGVAEARAALAAAAKRAEAERAAARAAGRAA